MSPTPASRGVPGAVAPAEGTPEREFLQQFLVSELERYSTLRDHKEAMAYTGLVLYFGAAVSALVSEKWSPPWGPHPRLLASAGVTVLLIAVLFYLWYQLRRRRWAQLRVAGCEWLLVSWLPAAPAPPAPATTLAPSGQQASPWLRVFDFLWPLKRGVGALDRSMTVYPPVVEEAWTNAELRGTDPLQHERLIQACVWVLYAAWIIRTSCPAMR
jgi:hypothetical protein